jgi:hypothetical protein
MSIWFCEMEINCPKQWDDLAVTSDPLVRDCDDCGKPVHFVDTPDKLENAAQNGQCVAFYSVKDEEVPMSFMIQLRRRWAANKKPSPTSSRRMRLGLPRSVNQNEKIKPFLGSADEFDKPSEQ